MNRIAIISLATLAGCATAKQVEALSTKLDTEKSRCEAMEQRLSRIEGDLYKVDVKSAPKAERAKPKLVPAQAVASNVIDTKIETFINEYVGVSFGDPMDNFSNTYNSSYANGEMKKSFQYFNKAEFEFTEKKLTKVQLYCYLDKKYSYDSCRERLEQTVADLLVTFGLASDYLDGYWTKIDRGKTPEERNAIRARLDKEAKPTFELSKYGFYRRDDADSQGGWRFSFTIRAKQLAHTFYKEAQEKRNSTGEELPEIK